MSEDTKKERRNLKVIQFNKTRDTLVENNQPKETFADIGGMDEVKKKIQMNFILPLKNPEIYQAYGRTAGGSLLMYGPPGCGKTFLAKAVAGEINASFIHLDLQAILSMWVGESEHNLHDIFEKARLEKPCVLFIDELDALGGNRQNLRAHQERMLVNQLLLELDGLQSHNHGVFVIGATNTPWYLDPALRRPGRFNHLVFVPPPSEKERELILELKTKNKPTKQLNLNKFAKKTQYFSGADLEHLVEDAVELVIHRSMETGEIIPITDKDMSEAITKRKPTTLEWFQTARNYATFSDVNKDYQIVLDYLKENRIK